MLTLKYCEICGKQGSWDARYCGACRRAFPGDSADEASEPTEPEPEAPVSLAPEQPDKERRLYDLRPLVLQSFPELAVALLTVGITAVALFLRRWDNRYGISSQRITLETGVLDKKRRTVELHRVQDLELREPLFLRLRSAGDLVVRSMDVGEREIVLRGIRGAREVHEAVRSAVLAERSRHKVRLLEGMG